MIINRDYIINRLSLLITNHIEEKNIQRETRLFQLKQVFPLWLRQIIFSAYNPIYLIYQKKQVPTLKFSSTDVTLGKDFISYCLSQNINFDTQKYYPHNSEQIFQDFIDYRIKSIIKGYKGESMNEIQVKSFRLEQRWKTHQTKRGGFHSLTINNKAYHIPNVFCVNVFEAHYGLREVPQAVINSIAGKNFLDIGALYGDASLMLLQYNPCKIYAYEPVKGNYNKLQKTIIKNKASDRICAVNTGIGNTITSAYISKSGASSKVQKTSNTDTEQIIITTIDEECKDKKVGLIKMDIEGFEYYAVCGGMETIKRDKPVLLISMYHTGKDFFEIPPLIKQVIPGYTFKFIDAAPHLATSEKVLVAYYDTH